MLLLLSLTCSLLLPDPSDPPPPFTANTHLFPNKHTLLQTKLIILSHFCRLLLPDPSDPPPPIYGKRSGRNAPPNFNRGQLIQLQLGRKVRV